MIKRIFLLAIILFIMVFSPLAYANDDLVIESWFIEGQLKENGDFHIVEDLNFDFSKDYNGVYRQIVLHSTDGVEDIEVFELVDNKEKAYRLVDKANKGDRDVFTRKQNKKRITLQIYSPSQPGENKVFRLSYKVKSVGVIHKDTGELYYRFVGKENETPIGYLSATIELPKTNRDRTKIFAHGPDQGSIHFIEDNLIRLEVSNVPAHLNIEGRILFPEEFIAASRNIGKSNFDKIMKEEQSYLDIMEKKGDSGQARKKIQENLSLGVSFAVILLISFFHRVTRKKPEIFENLQSLVPESISPAELRYFTNSAIIDTRAIMATVFDLAGRGFIGIEEFKNENDKRDFSFTKLREDTKGLLSHEAHLIHWLFSEIGNGKKVTSLDIGAYRKSSYRSFSTNFTSWSNKLKADLRSRAYFDHNYRMGAVALLLTVATFIVGLITLVFGVIHGLLPMFLSIILLIFSIKLFTLKSDKGYVEYKLWMDYKKALEKNLDLVENYDSIPEDRTLIYAIALGLPMKSLEGLKDKLAINHSLNPWVYWYFINNSKGGSSFEDSFNSSFYGSSALSTSSSLGGGGGFTPGGGGGAGGGGAGGF